MIFKLNNIK